MYFLLNSVSLTNKIPKVHLNNTSGKNGLFTATKLKVPQNMEKNILRRFIIKKPFFNTRLRV